MTAGWKLDKGEIIKESVSDDEFWKAFNYVFSSSSFNRTSYKFGLIKAILDNLFNILPDSQQGGYYISFDYLFDKFSENYWALVIKYNLKQIIKDGKSDKSKVEIIFEKAINEHSSLEHLSFSSIPNEIKNKIVRQIAAECKKYVLGALYSDLNGLVYAFDKRKITGIILSECAFEFLIKYKSTIEVMNYYSWAKFLEISNKPENTINLLDKLELATPRRNNLGYYWNILYNEFKEDTCFYCGKKIRRGHVDHFIPWKFIHEDKLWNLVVSCPSCNASKNARLANRIYLKKIDERNSLIIENSMPVFCDEFSAYSGLLMNKLYDYAQISGYKVWG